MDDPTRPLTDILTRTFDAFKKKDYDGVQELLRSKGYKQAIEALDPKAYMKDVLQHSLEELLASESYREKLSHTLSPEQLQIITTEALDEIISSKDYTAKIKTVNAFQSLKDTAVQLWEHMGVATRPDIRERLDDSALKSINRGIDLFEQMGKNDPASSLLGGGIGFVGQQAASSPTDQLKTTLTRLVKNLAGVVQKIDATRLEQADFVTEFEKALFEEKGWKDYYVDLVQRRWLGDHHAGKILEDGKIITPNPDTIVKSLRLEKKALEEFGQVTILDTPLKQAGATLASVAGIGLVAHGVHNVYRAFQPDPQEKLELTELGHVPPEDRVNWLRLVVGAGEIGAGAATLHRQLTGRWGLGAIEGKRDPLIIHTTPPTVGRG
jgi:hypothetical protein